jgi:hypothetical protein
MMSGSFWKSWWSLAFMVGPLLLVIVSFTLSIYIGSRHLNEMVDALKNSRHVVSHAGLRHQGWFGRQMLVAKITGVLFCSGLLVRRGEVDADDLHNFPLHLRRFLKAKMTLSCVIGVWAAMVFVALKLK